MNSPRRREHRSFALAASGSDLALSQDMKKTALLAALLLVPGACAKEETKIRISNAANTVKEKVQDAFDVAVPLGKRAQPPEDPKAREKARFDQQWRQLQSFRAEQQRQVQRQQAQQAAAVNVQFAPNGKESFKGLDITGINAAPVAIPIKGDQAGPSVLKTQVYLDRSHFSVGAIDGRWGKNSAISLWWWQRSHGLPATGEVDEQTYRALAGAAGAVPVVVAHALTEDDVKGPFVSIPSDVYDKQKLDCLCYESLKEKLAETFHTTTDFLEMLNKDMKFSDLKAGDSINVLNAREQMTADQLDIAKVVVSLAGNTFNAFDAAGNLIFHAPTTVGNEYDPSPTETVTVKRVVQDPRFHYQPTLFHEVPDTDPEAQLKAGPNSPVGVVWIALSKPHYGIHGTSDPDSIGYASSHGCIRLTNWDAREVSHRIKPDDQVAFVDTKHDSNTAAVTAASGSKDKESR